MNSGVITKFLIHFPPKNAKLVRRFRRLVPTERLTKLSVMLNKLLNLINSSKQQRTYIS